MGRAIKNTIVGLVLAGSCLFVATASAGELENPASPGGGSDELAAFGLPVSSDVLEAQSGGSTSIERIEILANSMNLNAEMKENLLFSTATGMNQISDNAFGNASGISTVVQNSGNQVIINNAFILNLQVQ